MFQKPSVADLRQAAQKLGMTPSDAYLNAVDHAVGKRICHTRRDAG